MFNTFFVKPLFNALVFLYQYVTFQDLGLAIILLTVIIRIILYPFFYKSLRNQAIIQKIQPEIKKIQENYKNNKEEQAKALLELYKLHQVNPFSGFLLIIIQLPILIALYRVFLQGLNEASFQNLYSFISQPQVIHQTLLGLINLSDKSIIIVGLAAFSQYLYGRLTLPQNKDNQSSTNARITKNMVLIMPLVTVMVLYFLPSAVGIYWLTTTIFSIGQQLYINKKIYGTNKDTITKNSGTGRI